MKSWWNWHHILVWPETLLLLLLLILLDFAPAKHFFVGSLLSCQGRIFAAVYADMLELICCKSTLRIGGDIPALTNQSCILWWTQFSSRLFPRLLTRGSRSEELWIAIRQNWHKPDLCFRPVKHICQRLPSIEDNFVCRISCCHLAEMTIII